jgi:hypothetical protein
MDKIAAAYEMEKSHPQPPVELNLPKDLEIRLNRLEQVVDTVETHFLSKPDVSAELVAAIADLRDNIAKINSRIIKIEEFLVHVNQPATCKDAHCNPAMASVANVFGALFSTIQVSLSKFDGAF